MNGYFLIWLLANYLLLLYLIATTDIVNRVIHEVDIGFSIIVAFFMWAAQCGNESYTITSTYNGKTREWHIG